MLRKLFVASILLITGIIAKAQPAGYVEGQARCWNYNGRDHIYYRSVGWNPLTDHILVFFGGDGQTDCSSATYPNLGNLDDMAPGNIIADNGDNWDGTTNGGGVKWLVLIIRNWGINPGDYANDIAFFFNNATLGYDTALHRAHISGGSGGVGRAIDWLQNTTVASGNPFRKVFSTGIWMSSTYLDITADFPVPYNMCWYGTGETQPPESYTFAAATIDLFNKLPGSAGLQKHIKSNPGSGHNNTTWGACYTVAGTDSSTNRWIWMVDMYNFNPPEPETKITGIQFSDIIDLQGGGGANAFTYFDEQSNVDPENGDLTPAPSTLKLPNSWNYFPKYFGRQWSFAVDLRANFDIKKLWYHINDNNGYYDDTIFIYKTNDFLTFTKVDSIRVVMGTTTGWYSKTLNTNTRYIVFGIKRRLNTTHNSYGSPDVREIIIYGNMTSPSREPAMPGNYAGTKRPKPIIGDFVGVNLIGGYVPMKELTDFNHIRIMNERWYLDDSMQNMPDKKFNGDHWNEFNGTTPWRAMYNMFDSLEYTTGFILPEWNNSSAKVDAQYGGPLGWPINNFGDNPLALSSYVEAGYMAWNLAAQFGAVAIDSNRLRIFRHPRYTGTNLNMHFTFGSEINRFWGTVDTSTSGVRYIGNLMCVIAQQMQYDGYQNSFGDSIGIKNADPNALLGMPADFEMDTIMLNSRVKLSRAMRTDNKNIFGSYQFNHYQEFDYGGSLGKKGVHAVKWNLSNTVSRLIDYSYRLDPNMLIMWTENGFDANPVTTRTAHPRTGSTWTDREWQAINLGWNIMEASKTNLDRYFIYVMVTNSPEDHGGDFQTSDLYTNYPSVIYKPPYYYVRNFIRTLKNYRHEATIQSSWRGVCIEKYRNVLFPDSVAYAVGLADTTGTTLTNQVIPMVNAEGTAKMVELSFTSFDNNETNIPITSEQVTVDVPEKIFIILASENVPSGIKNNFKGNWKKNKFLNLDDSP